MTFGVVIGKFLPPHRGHSYLIDTATTGADQVVVIVCAHPDDPIPARVRADLLGESHPAATVMVTIDDIPPDHGEATSRSWAERTGTLLRDRFGRGPDVVFTSEEYGPRYAAYLAARHVSVDPDRRRVPVSGSAIRADPWRHGDFLAPGVRAWYVRRICVLGAESTGTTTLARDLADHYGCAWVPEYGRTFCATAGSTIAWRGGDFAHIARQQQAEEDAAARVSWPLLICDTDALATAIWHERYLGAVPPELAALAADRTYALYVLTADDIPFVQDGTRDGEHVRSWMTGRFRQALADRTEPWIEVRGDRAARLAAAVAHIDELSSAPAGAR